MRVTQLKGGVTYYDFTDPKTMRIDELEREIDELREIIDSLTDDVGEMQGREYYVA